MHKLSSAAPVAGLVLLLAGCGTAPLSPDPLVSAARGLNLVFEQVCMPTILDGGNFGELARGRMMTPMEPATRGPTQASQTFRLGLTGVSASMWEDGSCAVAIERGDSGQLQAQTLASLHKRGHVMTPGALGRPAANGGVGAVYCNPDASPLTLTVTTPASPSANTHALVATLYRARDAAADVCPPRTRA